MFNPSNSLDDPAKASRSDYLRQDGNPDATYRYQTTAQSKGNVPVQNVPDNVKRLLSDLKLKQD